MRLSVKKATQELKQELEQELQKLRRVEVSHMVLERGLCLQHLLDGYEATLIKGYPVSNEVIKQLALEFPALVISG